MNYYLKVLRSNIDNILSSESISPAAFYSQREFGYRRFDMASDDKSEYELYLWDEVYETNEDVVYIELFASDSQLQNLTKSPNCSAYIVRKTIRLYPWNCRILFKKIEDVKETVFICRSSLTNKMWNYFHFAILTTWERRPSSCYAAELFKLNITKETDTDYQWNRVKGFLFTYFLGTFKSVSPPLSRLLQAEIKIYGLATVLSGMKTPDKGLLNNIEQQKRIFNNNDPNRSFLKLKWNEQILNQFTTQRDRQVFEKILGQYGVQRVMMDAFANEMGIALGPKLDMTFAAKYEWDSFKTSLHEYTKSILDQYKEKDNNHDRYSVEVDSLQIKLTGEDKVLYELLINHAISHPDFLSIERIRTQKLGVANEIAKFLKDYYLYSGRQWDDTDEQEYMSELRRNIAYSTPFDVNRINDKVLRALAVYILKGDTVDDMIKFIQMSAIEDYSMIFGFWGANVGYTDIPKTFFSLIEVSPEEQTDSHVRSCELLTGDYVECSLNPDSYMEALVNSSGEIMKPGPVSQLSKIEKTLGSSSIHLTQSQVDEVMKLISSSNYAFDAKFYKLVGKIKGIGKKKLLQIQQLLNPYAQEDRLRLSNDSQTKTSSDYVKQDLWPIIEDCLPESRKVRSQVKKDVVWFLKNNPLPMPELLTKICDYLNRNKNATKSRYWLREVYKDVDVQLIEYKLREGLQK
mgnify:CR=1 FL=1